MLIWHSEVLHDRATNTVDKYEQTGAQPWALQPAKFVRTNREDNERKQTLKTGLVKLTGMARLLDARVNPLARAPFVSGRGAKIVFA